MDDNNNIEDFFKKSLEGFNESPSEAVWKGVSDSLNAPVPYWKRIILPLLIGTLLFSLLGVGVYAYSLNQKLDDSILQIKNLTNSTDIQSKRIAAFEKNEIEVNSFISQLESEKSTIAEEFSDYRSQSLKSGNWLNIHPKVLRSNLAFIKSLNTVNLKPEVLDGSRMSNNYSTVENLNSRIGFAKSNSDLMTNNLRAKVSFPIRIEDKFNGFRSVEKSAGMVTNFKRLKYNFPSYYFGSYLTQRKLNPIFKYGFTASLIGTKTDVTSNLDPGYNAGLSLEMQLFRKFWLTSGIRYNRNNYMMEFKGQNPVKESRFPTPRSLNYKFDMVHVKNSFIDFPFGLSFNLPISRKNSIFINPGISWQFYLPQKYIYNTIDNGQFDYSENRYFMYFGSAFMNAGIERKISDNRSFQFSFWAEKGLSQYGFENRQIMNYGLKATLYFPSQ